MVKAITIEPGLIDQMGVELMKTELAVVDTATPNPIRFDLMMVSIEGVNISMIGPVVFDLAGPHTSIIERHCCCCLCSH